ncbi:hypothetical protein GOODEAATRI_014156, partial [Goodea atripinnis]
LAGVDNMGMNFLPISLRGATGSFIHLHDHTLQSCPRFSLEKPQILLHQRKRESDKNSSHSCMSSRRPIHSLQIQSCLELCALLTVPLHSLRCHHFAKAMWFFLMQPYRSKSFAYVPEKIPSLSDLEDCDSNVSPQASFTLHF